MAEFLTTNGTSHHIENIIIEAKNTLFLVSPFLQLSKTLNERLKDASNRNVKIKIIYGKDELKPNEKSSLAELKNLELFYFENLHAKCYFNENKMVITSMNMYAFSEKTNREMGVLIDRGVDRELFDKAAAETQSILQSANVITLRKPERHSKSIFPDIPEKVAVNSNYQKHIGFCIRCVGRIDYNPEQPYCSSCYSTWSKFENPDYIEKACHRCGGNHETSMNAPLENDCYRLWKEEQKPRKYRRY